MYIQAVETINRFWEVAGDEGKQGMARHLFDQIIFDLDQQIIVDFRLKPWADQFIISRIALHLEENDELDNDENRVVLTGIRTAPLPSLNAANRLIERLYRGIPFPQKPITEKHSQRRTQQPHL